MKPEAFLQALFSTKAELRVEHGGLSHFRSDWGFPSRRIDSSILYFVLRGGIRLHLDEPGAAPQGVLIPSGHLLWLAPKRRHRMEKEKSEGPLVTWHLRLSVRLGRHIVHPAFTHLIQADSGFLQQKIASLVQASHQFGPHSVSLLKAHAFLLCHELMESRAPESARALTQRQLGILRSWLDGHWHANPVPAELASCLGLSPVYFTRLFRRSTGLSPRVWLVRERIRRAAASIAEGETDLTALSKALGYRELSLFSRQFKKVMGSAPREFRLRWGG